MIAQLPPTYLVGDSLAQGQAMYAEGLSHVDTRVGRSLQEGMGRIEDLTGGKNRNRAELHGKILLVSLGTNNYPLPVSTIRRAVEETQKYVGGRGLVVWATLHVRGRNYTAVNTWLREHHAVNYRCVRWSGQVARTNLLTSDGVHATPAGYRLRARLYAAAVKDWEKSRG